jgi:phage protein D
MSPTSEQYVALYGIRVDGSELADDLKNRVREVRVSSYLRLPDVCTLSVSFQKGLPGAGEPIDGHPFAIGSSLEILLGARDSLTTSTLFKGEIVTIEPRFGAGSVEMTVRAFDPLHKLLRSRQVRTFQNQTTSDIVQKVVSEAGFSVTCDSSGDPHDFMAQSNETDWDFIWRLAERVGFELVIENGTIHFRKPSPDASVSLSWPDTLHSFNPRLTAIQQVEKVTLAAFDPTVKDAISVSVSSANQIAEIGVSRSSVVGAFPGAELHVATEPVKTQSEGQALAQALLDKLANGYIAAEGVTDGNPAIRAGVKIQVSGLGSKFSGTYRVATATHLLRGGGTYETHFANSPAHTLLGAVGGDRGTGQPDFAGQLVLGEVTNNDDPDAMGRVRVKYPALGDNAEGTWARVLVPSSGDARGLLMLPQVGEEVLVGFEHDDVTRPYVLGSLFNGKQKPGDDLIQTKDGSFAVLSDKKVIIQSKGDQVIKSAGKMTVEVDDNVEEKYKRDWTNEITGQATLKATQPFEIDGQNVTIKGTAQISIEGNAQVTIKCGPASIQLSSGGVQISGPMIQLG